MSSIFCSFRFTRCPGLLQCKPEFDLFFMTMDTVMVLLYSFVVYDRDLMTLEQY